MAGGLKTVADTVDDQAERASLDDFAARCVLPVFYAAAVAQALAQRNVETVRIAIALGVTGGRLEDTCGAATALPDAVVRAVILAVRHGNAFVAEGRSPMLAGVPTDVLARFAAQVGTGLATGEREASAAWLLLELLVVESLCRHVGLAVGNANLDPFPTAGPAIMAVVAATGAALGQWTVYLRRRIAGGIRRLCLRDSGWRTRGILCAS